MYLILSSHASARLCIIGSMASALTDQEAFLNNFENIVNRRVDIREDIKHCQDTLSYALSKVNCNRGEGVYMLPSDMNLSDSRFSLGRNGMVNVSVPEKSSHKASIIPKYAHKEVPSKHTSASEVELTL